MGLTLWWWPWAVHCVHFALPVTLVLISPKNCFFAHISVSHSSKTKNSYLRENETVTKHSLFCRLLLVFHYEKNVEKVCADDCKVECEYCGPTNLEKYWGPTQLSKLKAMDGTGLGGRKITWVLRCAATCIPNARPQNRNVSITINLFSFQPTKFVLTRVSKIYQSTWLFFPQWWLCQQGGSWRQGGRQGRLQSGLGGTQTASTPSRQVKLKNPK